MASAAKQAASPRSGWKCHGSGFQGALPTAACLLLSVGSIATCLLANFRTAQLERRVHALERERAAALALEPETSVRDAADALLREKLNMLEPKLRTAREAPAHCSCPPEGRLGTITKTVLFSAAFQRILSGHREKEEEKEKPDLLARQDGMGIRVLLEWMESLDPLARKEVRDHRDRKEIRVTKETPGQRDPLSKVHTQAFSVTRFSRSRAIKDKLGLLVLPDLPESRVREGPRATQERMGPGGHLESQVMLEIQGSLDPKDLQGQRGRWVLLVTRGREGWMVCQA
ncbi:uncharacterized protein LOC114910419 [Scleropages formosus]|uniref:uncharacterized protein LOC114910419 n=1 Tax=Scleropages formosus TaxID=113540 RepID=UPI0010FA70D2|nr:uncharacterized protein LOC114910419 [Scleropages formosus]